MFRYHDSTNVSNDKIDLYESKAVNQDQLVLDFFRTWNAMSFTAPEVWEKIKWKHKPPLTSVRRAISNLEKHGFIEKGPKRDGLYGRENYAWKLR